MLSSRVSQSTAALVAAGLACALSLGALAASVYTHRRAAALPVAYVDTDRLFNAYQAMLAARRVYQGQKQEWEHNLRTLAGEAAQAQADRQRLPAGAGAGARAAGDAAVRVKQQQFVNYRQAVARQEAGEMQRLTRPVVAAANRYLAAYGKQHGYALVLSAAGPADLVYVAEPLDITDRVIHGLNQALADSLNRFGPKPTK